MAPKKQFSPVKSLYHRGLDATGDVYDLRIINAEKSEFNEDQAACGKLCIQRCEFGIEEEWLTVCPEEVSTAQPEPHFQARARRYLVEPDNPSSYAVPDRSLLGPV